jgi:hypothetical protein
MENNLVQKYIEFMDWSPTFKIKIIRFSITHDLMVKEAQATLRAAKFIRDLGLQFVILEGDSLQALNVNDQN